MKQLSKEWHHARLGKITASRLSDVMSKIKSGYSASRKNYMMQLICEKLSGYKEEGHTNAAMQRGIDVEPIARGAYEADKGLFVEECGFIVHPVESGFGASPDDLVSDDGLIEIKCPNTATHLGYILDNKMPSEYVIQVQSTLWMTGCTYWDFESYDPRFPKRPYWKIRVERDEKKIQEIEEGINLFIEELKELIERILK